MVKKIVEGIFIYFLRQKADRPAPKHRRQFTTWQVFRQVERRFHSRDSNCQPLPWDLGIPLPSPGSLRSSRTKCPTISMLWVFNHGLFSLSTGVHILSTTSLIDFRWLQSTPTMLNTCFRSDASSLNPQDKLGLHFIPFTLAFVQDNPNDINLRTPIFYGFVNAISLHILSNIMLFRTYLKWIVSSNDFFKHAWDVYNVTLYLKYVLNHATLNHHILFNVLKSHRNGMNSIYVIKKTSMAEINRVTIWGYEHCKMEMSIKQWFIRRLRPWNNIEVLCNNLGVVVKWVHICTPIMCHKIYEWLFIWDKTMMQYRTFFFYEDYVLKICQKSLNWIPWDEHIVLN